MVVQEFLCLGCGAEREWGAMGSLDLPSAQVRDSQTWRETWVDLCIPLSLMEELKPCEKSWIKTAVHQTALLSCPCPPTYNLLMMESSWTVCLWFMLEAAREGCMRILLPHLARVSLPQISDRKPFISSSFLHSSPFLICGDGDGGELPSLPASLNTWLWDGWFQVAGLIQPVAIGCLFFV